MIPFVWSTDAEKRLVKLEVSSLIVHLVEERRRYWRTLRYLAGRHIEQLDADHHVELEALRQRYQESEAERESSLDTIAQAMSELAASSSAPPASLAAALAPFGGAAPGGPAPAAAESAGNAAASGLPIIRDEDVPKNYNRP